MKRTSFNDGWEFARGEGAFAPVVVPHDAMLGNRRAADAPGGSASGFYFGDVYRYRKEFDVSKEQAAGALLLEFEGVYRDARITVNGAEAFAPPYGFVPFFTDITGLVHSGRNVVEVQASNADQPDCRWYSGGGIHRPVWLWEGGPARILPEGIRVTTESIDPAVVRVQVQASAGNPQVKVADAEGSVVACAMGTDVRLAIPDAQLWSDWNPYLYTCEVELEHEGRLADRAQVRFGIRTLEWSPRGLFVNGRETLLRGGCVHCDNGIVGAASFSASERRRAELLKAAGFNAIRVAHNPAPTALLDACDELGLYVMDETWDQWFTRKSAHDYAQQFLDWCDYDLHRLVARDFNHPSVIMYSIGNEIADPLVPGGVELERSLVDLLHSLDPSRPVTCGFNLTMMVMERVGQGWYRQADGVAAAAQAADEPPRGSLLFNLAAQATGSGMTLLANAPGADRLVSPALDALDIAGYNYAAARYGVDARKHPARVVVGSETFPYELDRNWEQVKRLPTVVGDFMWAAWDYLGEAGAGAWAYAPEEAGFSKPWPWLIAGSGALDILGHPNAHAAKAAAVWGAADKPQIMVRPVNAMAGKTYRATWRGSDAIPSWSWAGCAGTIAQVEVYDARAHSVRLELNGQDVGTARVRRFVARFRVAYQPGVLRAVALDEDGRELASSSLTSANDALRLRVRPERPSVFAGELAYVAVDIVGSNGHVESNADERVSVSVQGGRLIGFGSARPATVERFQDGAYTTYRGRALAAVYCSAPGTVTVTATGATLPAATAELRVQEPSAKG